MSKLRSTTYLTASRGLTLILSVWAFGQYYEWIGPKGWGAIALAAVVGNVLLILSDMGSANGTLNAVVRALNAGDDRTADRVLTTHRIYVLGTSLIASLAFVAMFFLGLIEGVGRGWEGILFYGAAIAALLIGLMTMGVTSLSNARGDFGFTAISTFTGNSINILTSLGLVYWFRHPWGYMMGSAVGMLVILLMLEIRSRKFGYFKVSFRGYWDDFRETFLFMKRSIPGSLGLVFGGSEKLVGNRILGQDAIGVYDVAARLPQTFTQIMPVGQVIQPELVRAHAEGPEAFRSTYARLMPAALALVLAALFVPSAFGGHVLQLVFKSYQPVMFFVFVASCLDAALIIYGSLFFHTAGGAGKPHVVAPLIWYANLGAALLTIPAAMTYGILGMAISRVTMQLIQVFLIEITIKKHVIPTLDLRAFMVRKLTILGISGVFWLVGYAVALQSYFESVRWISIPIAVAFGYAYLSVLIVMKLVAIPEKLLRLFPKSRRA